MITPKHFCFDLDGTLTTVPRDYPKTVITKTFKQLGRPGPSETDIQEIWFGADKDGYIKKILGLDIPNFWKTFDLFDTPKIRAEQTVVFPDVIETLSELARRGHLL